MQTVIICNQDQQAELMKDLHEVPPGVQFIPGPEQLPETADAIMDLLFDNTPERIGLLSNYLPATIVVNSVSETLGNIHPSFTRINAWPGFLSSSIIEASCLQTESKPHAEALFQKFNRHTEWLPDEPGFVSARVIGMIINEAHLALDEGVSTKEDIDTAMKMGTNYPFGPFEWEERIGKQQVSSLLKKLSVSKTPH